LRIDGNEKPWLLNVSPYPYKGLINHENEDVAFKILKDTLVMINLTPEEKKSKMKIHKEKE
jgi:hypothetical protein